MGEREAETSRRRAVVRAFLSVARSCSSLNSLSAANVDASSIDHGGTARRRPANDPESSNFLGVRLGVGVITYLLFLLGGIKDALRERAQNGGSVGDFPPDEVPCN